MDREGSRGQHKRTVRVRSPAPIQSSTSPALGSQAPAVSLVTGTSAQRSGDPSTMRTSTQQTMREAKHHDVVRLSMPCHVVRRLFVNPEEPNEDQQPNTIDMDVGHEQSSRYHADDESSLEPGELEDTPARHEVEKLVSTADFIPRSPSCSPVRIQHRDIMVGLSQRPERPLAQSPGNRVVSCGNDRIKTSTPAVPTMDSQTTVEESRKEITTIAKTDNVVKDANRVERESCSDGDTDSDDDAPLINRLSVDQLRVHSLRIRIARLSQDNIELKKRNREMCEDKVIMENLYRKVASDLLEMRELFSIMNRILTKYGNAKAWSELALRAIESKNRSE